MIFNEKFFKQIVFYTPRLLQARPEEEPRGMELQGKEAEKDKGDIGKLFKNSPYKKFTS